MPRSYNALTKTATFSTDQMVVQASETGDQAAKCLFAYQETVRKLIREAWPEATAKELAHAGKISVRQAERVLGRQQGISIELIFQLLHNEQIGRRIHWAILDHVATKWGAVHRHDREYIAIQNERRLLEQREEEWRNRRAG